MITPKIHKIMKMIAQMSIDRASRSLSKMVKAGAKIELDRADIIDISKVTAQFNAKDADVMGAFVSLEGSAPFKFLFYTDAPNSLILAELILQKKIVGSDNVDLYARSAIQEIGNILASAVANVFVLDLGISMKPSPPTVVHDFIGAVFQEYMLSVVPEVQNILIIESKFCIVRSNIKCHMFALPMAGSEKIIEEMCRSI